ncbi:hydrogenase [Candidatus Sumerlaeota bacterium]|nr:hydrogenase [Candidatus Sumerlaeota bacterium]
MNGIWLILIAVVTMSCSGLPALFLPRRGLAGQRCTAALLAAGSLLGLCGVGDVIFWATPSALESPWFLPVGGFSVSLDAIGAIFLTPVFVVPTLGAFYGLGYWKQTEYPENGRKLGLFYGLLAGSMAMVVIARDAVLFLTAWELMALSAYFAATAEDDDPSVQRAGWVYLVATHVGTLCLTAMFMLLRHGAGSFSLLPLEADEASSSNLTAIFVLAVIGFGFKAGLMPLHVWLPGAHANAPSHVSAVMSGVMLKMGIYGIVRITALLPAPPTWWGGTLLGIGAASGILGIAFAIGQGDLKRVLAYSSIENIGIITMGLGLAMLGRSLQRADWIALGLGGGLLHVWNHSIFKPLLFLNAGAILHATHTREIDRMGGLAKRMPRSAIVFLLGSAAICGLPPLNGFASEWLIYVGFLRTTGAADPSGYPAAALGGAALAMIGALATACFVRLFGTIFLGQSRSGVAENGRDPGAALSIPISILGIGCVTAGLVPWVACPLLDRASAAWSGMTEIQPLRAIAPMGWISAMALALIGTSTLVAWLLMRSLGERIARRGTWDCGYAGPTARMQYTGSSFGQSLVAMFAWALWPKVSTPQIRDSFPRPAEFKSGAPDAVLERLVLPFLRFAERQFLRLRLFQQGSIQVYIIYFLAGALLLLVWGRTEFQP